MKALRTTLFALLTVSTLAACGQAGPAGIGSGAQVVSNGGAHVMKGPGGRKLDYGWDRYKKVFAPKARPAKMPRQGLLPTRVDLRDKQAAVYDQGKLGACTAFAMGKGMREHMQRANDERLTGLSALFLYYEERVKMGTRWQDSGATITDGMTVLKEKGIATDEAWPYATNFLKFRLKPSKGAYGTAAEFKVKETAQLGALDDVRAVLAKGQSVAFGFLVYESFGQVGRDGVMPMPKPGEQIQGGHAVLAVGYDDQKRHLIVRNSWSAAWGDKGYFYMPYDFAANKEQADDFWTAAR